MIKHFTRWATSTKGWALGILLASTATVPAAAQTVYGLAASISLTGVGSFRVVTFQASAPGTFTANVPITGLADGQILVGIDSRPATGQLFALGYNSSNSQAQLYTLAPTTGALTTVGTVQTLTLGSAIPPLRIGFDFNPTADRIRVTAGNRANYRLNPNDGTIAATDGTLTYAATDPNMGTTPVVGSSAYTNSYIGSTATTLYNLDEGASRLVTQNPPNDGILNTVGLLGVTVNSTTQVSDLDIYFDAATGQNTAYLSVLTANIFTFSAATTLYTVNLSTGAATSVGTLGNSTSIGVLDIAAATGVVTSSRPAEVASNFALYPNPAGAATSLAFGLPRPAHVELTVTDALGRTVSHVDAGQLAAGPQTIRWNRAGQAAGLYLFRLSFDGQLAGTRQAAITE